MMRCLREANVDHNTVGWYQCIPYKMAGAAGSWWNTSLIETCWNYQKTLGEKCVVLVYEAHKALQGNLGVSAYRLTNNFYALYRNKKFTTSELKQLNISPSSIVERIPVTLRVNPLQRVLFQSINLQLPSSSVLGDPERFLLAEHDQPSLERASASVVEVIDDWQQDQNQWMYWWRGAQREQSRYAQALNKKRMENSSRIAQGLAGWTEEEIVANLDAPRIPTEPSRLDVLLVEASLFSHCSELERVANDAIIKAYTAKAFQQ